jgi:PleD family two-component response regulator
VRGAIERLSIPWQARTLKVTLSGGVASLRECGASVKGDALVALADKRLYEAKQNGRNRIC